MLNALDIAIIVAYLVGVVALGLWAGTCGGRARALGGGIDTAIIVIAVLTGLYTIVGGLLAGVLTETVQTVILVTSATFITAAGDPSGMPWYAIFLGYPVRGTYHTRHFGLPKLLARDGGSILNLASMASKVGLQDRFAYSMTKGTMLSMTLSVARDFVNQNIHGNCVCVCPAGGREPFVEGFIARSYPGKEAETFKKHSASQPIGRMDEPDEFAALAAFLSSAEADFITGSAYDIDGGVTLLR
jgi:NAD(P)-dependent dehydrogenase (short-subunit alcohol dehydrogenase family)